MQGFGPIGSCFSEAAKGASLEEKEFIIHEID